MSSKRNGRQSAVIKHKRSQEPITHHVDMSIDTVDVLEVYAGKEISFRGGDGFMEIYSDNECRIMEDEYGSPTKGEVTLC